MGSPKSGKPTGAGRPSGTAEQRAYYGAPTTPSGTPRAGQPSVEFQRKLEEDIKAKAEAEKQYILGGKSVSATEYQQAIEQQKARAGEITQGVREQAQRQTALTLAGSSAFQKTLREKKLSEEEKARLKQLIGAESRILVGSKGTGIVEKYTKGADQQLTERTYTYEQRARKEVELKEQQKLAQENKLIQEGLKKPFYTKEKLQAQLQQRKQEIKGFFADVKTIPVRHEQLKQKYYTKYIPEFPSYEKYRAYSLVTQPSRILSYVVSPKSAETETQLRYGIAKGGYEIIKYKPEIPLITAGAFAIATPILGAVAATGLIPAGVAKTGGAVLLGAYGYTKGKEIYQTPTTIKKGEIIGKTIVGEIIPAFAGSYAGLKIAEKPLDFFRKIGKTKVAPESVAEKMILEKKAVFPTAPVREHLQRFKVSPYRLPGETKQGVWHATSKPFAKETTAGKGSSELPGLFGAPSLSVHFTRISKGGYSPFGLGLPEISRPTGIRIYPTKIISGKAKWISRTKAIWLQDLEKGVAYVPALPGKTETQAVISMGTPLKQLANKYYTDVWGRVITLPQYEAVSGGIAKGTTTLGKLSSKYYTKKPILTPYSLIPFTASQIPYKITPTLPRTTGLYSDIVESVRYTPDAITGSYAQKALVSRSRKFSDIDIVSPNVQDTISRIQSRIGDKVYFKKGYKSTKVIERSSGKELADIVPYEIGEKPSKVSYVSRYGTTSISGVSLVRQEARLSSKIEQLKSGISKAKYEKIASDIRKLTSATGYGGYGFRKTTYTPPPPTRKGILKAIVRKIKSKKYAAGFETFAKTKGEWIKISQKPLRRSEAIRLGEKIVGKESLSAQFMIKPSKSFVEGAEDFYRPSKREFRSFKIVKGKQIPLKDKWIERSTFRIEKRGRSKELGLIQKAKRKKKKGLWGDWW